eukprot:scaffold18239_cov112-Isochrysis_galbana.AAC.1
MAPAGKSSATARLFGCLRAFPPSGIAGDRPRPMRRAFRRSPARCEHCLRCQPTRGQFPARVPGKLQALCTRGLLVSCGPNRPQSTYPTAWGPARGLNSCPTQPTTPNSPLPA